jgi:hypothetical protein
MGKISISINSKHTDTNDAGTENATNLKPITRFHHMFRREAEQIAF